MSIFNCFNCFKYSKVTPHHQTSSPLDIMDFYTYISTDSNGRVFETKYYERTQFTNFDPDSFRKIRETIIYTLEDPTKIAIRICMYDRGFFTVHRYVKLHGYFVYNEENENKSYYAKFLGSTDHTIIVQFSKRFNEYLNSCPGNGLKIFTTDNGLDHEYECGKYVGT